MRINKIIHETVFLTKPKGKAAQDAAIAAIYTLGINNRILFEPALQGLESLSKFTESGKKYFELITQEQSKIQNRNLKYSPSPSLARAMVNEEPGKTSS